MPPRKGSTKSDSTTAKDKTEYAVRNYSGLAKLNKEYRALIQPVLGKRGFSGLEIIESWTEIVGEDLAVGIRPEKLKFEKGQRINGVLYVKSAGGAFALLCAHHQALILERINTFFGYPAVSQIKILQGKLKFTPVETPKETFVPTEAEQAMLEKKVAFVADEELKKILYDMGLALLESKRKKG